MMWKVDWSGLAGAASGVRRRARRWWPCWLAVAVGLTVVASLAVGAKPIPPGTVVEALLAPDPGAADHLVVRELRWPRTLLGAVVGASLGLAGALMQAVTRNPIAEPGLLGVNAGAACAVVVAISAFGVGSMTALVWFALAGAGAATVAVYALGTLGGGATPVRLALAGAATSALLLSVTRAITLLDAATLDRFRFWAVGSLVGRDAGAVGQVAPFALAGVALAAVVARRLDLLALGDDVAVSLGADLATTRLLAGAAVTLLCGAAVAAAGPIGFVGLVVPHAVRLVAGPSASTLLAASALLGASVVLLFDVVGRLIARPGEVQVGVVAAAIGGPIFVALARRSRVIAL